MNLQWVACHVQCHVVPFLDGRGTSWLCAQCVIFCVQSLMRNVLFSVFFCLQILQHINIIEMQRHTNNNIIEPVYVFATR